MWQGQNEWAQWVNNGRNGQTLRPERNGLSWTKQMNGKFNLIYKWPYVQQNTQSWITLNCWPRYIKSNCVLHTAWCFIYHLHTLGLYTVANCILVDVEYWLELHGKPHLSCALHAFTTATASIQYIKWSNNLVVFCPSYKRYQKKFQNICNLMWLLIITLT